MSFLKYRKPQGFCGKIIVVMMNCKVNRKAIADGRCDISEGSAVVLPFSGESFGIVTAFENVCFWPEIEKCFCEVYRILKPDGCFMICSETKGETDKDDKWIEKIV